MTRSTDTGLALGERTALANRIGADAFVSIHANSNSDKKVRGIETYYLDVTDDAYSLRLAAVENKTSEEEVSDLQLILADRSTKRRTTLRARQDPDDVTSTIPVTFSPGATAVRSSASSSI